MRTTIDTLLDDLLDTRELVVHGDACGDPLLAAWRATAADAQHAYACWSAAPGALAHAAYLAAADQEDAAAATLAADRAGACAPHAPRPLAA